MQRSTCYSHFIQALNVTNAALERHRRSHLFQPLLIAAAELADCDFVVEIVASEDALTPQDYVTIRLQDGTFVLVAHARLNDEIAWRVSERYLNHVATHPMWYVDHPNRLDLDWLKLRIGLTRRSPSDATNVTDRAAR
ncbi:MAG: hypothetical protein KF861_24750 [Planctomycetaceae bacterium]|nr:hypothetical protein [Planctomycetaceae bacterium]